ncbi:MAG: hypothetical protein CMP47_15545, partial [Rickettsiales bacterium]|nr:hypothetical protein [Rickettsiales bacterium]
FAAESSRLGLQPLDIEEHLESYHLLMSNELSMRWSMRKPSTSISESLENMRNHRPTPDKPWNQRWAIMLKGLKEDEKPKMIGVVGIVREAELGYRIHPDFWGKGFMSEALTMFLEMWWALQVSQKYDRLIAAADPENLASTRILVKHGFVKGEYKKEIYARACLGGEVKSDLQYFYLERPVTRGEV